MRRYPVHHCMAALLCVVFTAKLSVQAQSTAFTYQGRLNESAIPATGTFDFEFQLFDAATDGSPVGDPILIEDEPVLGGVFTTDLDFGSAFDGGERFLSIAVRPGDESGAFVALSPRQPVTASPYALKAFEAAAVPAGAITAGMLADGAVSAAKIQAGAVSGLGTPDGSNAEAVTVNDDGFVGMGTNAPGAGLHVASSAVMFSLEPLFQVTDGVEGFDNLDGILDVDVDGDLLAMAAQFDSGFTLVDVSDPTAPVILSQVSDGQGVFTNLAGARSVSLSGGLLAVAAENDDAVTLVDVTDPANPVRRSILLDGVGGFDDLGGAYHVAIQGDLMAVVGRKEDAVTLVDVSDPVLPQLHAVLTDGMFGFDELGVPASVTFSEDLMIVAAEMDDAVTLVDVSNPANPILRSVLKDGVNGFEHLDAAFAVSVSGDLLAVAALDDDAVSLIDISDPAAPALRSVLQDGVSGFSHLNVPRGLAMSGNRLAVTSFFEDGVSLVDVTDPQAPRLIGLGINQINGLHQLHGTWGVTFAGDDLVVAGRTSRGLSLLRPQPRSVGLISNQRVGIGTPVPLAPLHVEGNFVVSSADEVNIQVNRFATGARTIASGSSSTAMGAFTTASGAGSTALGIGSSADGHASIAMGLSSDARGTASTAMGSLTTATGDSSTAMGRFSSAVGRYSLAAGHRAQANHHGAFVWADSRDQDFPSTAEDEFAIRAANGVRIANAGNGVTLLRLESERPWEFRQRSSGASTALELVSLDSSGIANKDFIVTTTGSGGVGIGTSDPDFKLHVNGSVAGVGAYNSLSDRRYKKNIAPLTNALEIVEQLRGVRFDWRRAEHPERQFDEGRQLGLVAQELQNVLPEAVSEGSDGTLHAAYAQIIPVLIEAIKEQSREFEAQQTETIRLRREVRELKESIDSLAGTAIRE